MAATHLKKLRQGQQKAGRVSCAINMQQLIRLIGSILVTTLGIKRTPLRGRVLKSEDGQWFSNRGGGGTD